MSLREMSVVGGRRALREAAAQRGRVRVRGVVVETGEGYSGTYRMRWVRIRLASGVHVRMGASRGGVLGSLDVGAVVEVVVELTGMFDIAEGTYFGARARLLSVR